MELDFSQINWIAVIVCIVLAQILLTVWFTVIFGDKWAKAYNPVKTKKQHTAEVPGYTYAIQIICTALLIIGISVMQSALGIRTIFGGLDFGIWVAVVFSIATALPGYAFLRRWNAFYLAIGSQSVLIIIVSMIIAVWK